jgi:phage gp29-like protein
MRLFNRFFRNKNDLQTKSRAMILSRPNAYQSLFDRLSLEVSEQWLSKDETAKIMNYPIVESAINSRKAASRRKEIIVESDNEKIANEFYKILDGDFLDQLLDVPYQGFGVWELNYYEIDGLLYPTPIERDFRNFTIKGDQLYFTGDGTLTELIEYKTISVFHRKKFDKPYGESLLKKLYFPVKFGTAGMDFWLKFIEKFGSPWAVGKTDGDKNDMADELFNMLSGDVAVLEREDDINLINPTAAGTQRELVEKADNYIREIILGGNLTSEVKSGSFAAANVHWEVRDDIALSDKQIINKALSQLQNAFKAVNNFSGDLEFYLKDEDDPQQEFAARDLILYQMGYQRDQEEIENFYNVKVKPIEKSADFLPNKTQLIVNKSTNVPKYEDELDYHIQQMDFTDAQEEILKYAQELLSSCDSYQEAINALAAAFKTISFPNIEAALEKAYMNAAILGAAEVEKARPNG